MEPQVPSKPSSSEPVISIIIVNYQSLEYLEKCLDHLAEAEIAGDLEIIVVNNSPGDGTAQKLAGNHPSVILVEPGENLGFGPACNQGFKRATGDLVLLLNPDAFIAPDAISLSARYMRDHPKVAVVGGQMLSEEGHWQPSARCFPTVLDKFFMLTGLAARFRNNRFFGRMDLTWWDHSHPRKVDWVVGAFFMVRADVIKQVEGFDPRFFMYFEELDLCRRVIKKGMEVHYLPQVTVRHIGGASSLGAESLLRSPDGQLTLFRLFSEALYYGKYYGKLGPLVMLGLESAWWRLRWLKNVLSRTEESRRKALDLQFHLKKIKMVLRETRYGQAEPPQPWSLELRSYKHWKEA